MLKQTSRRLVLAGALAMAAWPALANHPGENLDERMLEMEKYFQPIEGEQAPGFKLQDAEGRPVGLSELQDKVVVLHFIYASCPDVCPLHADKIATIQESINASPMGDMVEFVSITTDPANDTPNILRDYAGWHDLDTANWTFLTTRPDQPEDTTRALASDYGVEFTMSAESDAMMHAPVTFVIDRGGRLAAKFHGMEFQNANLVLYVSGLINNAQHRHEEEGWWHTLTNVFR
ncbi:SCO family protein [Roseivivax sediminis]|nr:SCO family protein [Roseivivax sediminis]